MDQTSSRRRLTPEKGLLERDGSNDNEKKKEMDTSETENGEKALNKGMNELAETSMAESENLLNNEGNDEDEGFTLVERGKNKMKQNMIVNDKVNRNEKALSGNEAEQRRFVTEDLNANVKSKGNTERNVNEARERHNVEYKREWTVLIETENINGLSVMTLIKEIEAVVGYGALLALRPKQNKQYEATLNSEKACEKIEEGLFYEKERVGVTRLHKSEVLVSFLHLPPDVPDAAILARLARWGVLPILPVRRRYYPGTNVADGTRFLKVRFPKEVVSLPYSARFETEDGPQYCRVIHDRQVKICCFCMSPGHVLRDCPGFACRECLQQGHYARECDATKCPDCRRAMIRCTCLPPDGSEEEQEQEQQIADMDIERSETDGEGGCSAPPPPNEGADSEINTDVEFPCGQPPIEPVVSPGSTDMDNAGDVGSVELVEGTGQLQSKEAVPVGGMGEKGQESDLSGEEELQQDEETKVKELSTCPTYKKVNLKNQLKKKKKKRISVNLESVLKKQESRRGRREDAK